MRNNPKNGCLLVNICSVLETWKHFMALMCYQAVEEISGDAQRVLGYRSIGSVSRALEHIGNLLPCLARIYRWGFRYQKSGTYFICGDYKITWRGMLGVKLTVSNCCISLKKNVLVSKHILICTFTYIDFFTAISPGKTHINMHYLTKVYVDSSCKSNK